MLHFASGWHKMMPSDNLHSFKFWKVLNAFRFYQICTIEQQIIISSSGFSSSLLFVFNFLRLNATRKPLERKVQQIFIHCAMNERILIETISISYWHNVVDNSITILFMKIFRQNLKIVSNVFFAITAQNSQ